MSQLSPDTQKQRQKIEEDIIRASKEIHLPQGDGCYDDEKIYGFLQIWDALKTYYKNSHDTDIGVEVVREYLDWMRRFNRVSVDENRSEACRDEAFDAYRDLEAILNDIIRIIELRKYPEGR